MAFYSRFRQITHSLPGSSLLLFEVGMEQWQKWSDTQSLDLAPTLDSVVSQCVTYEQIESPIYAEWCNEMHDTRRYSRKQWEYVYVLEALRQANLITEGHRGLGFAVGTEPIPAVLAKYGVDVMATDLPSEDVHAMDWQRTGQHSETVEHLNSRGICDSTKFADHVEFRPVNMRSIPEEFHGQFDFVWSCCAIEHLGSLEAGLNFVKNSLQCLKPGGVAVHTTEYCVNSNTQTISRSSTVLYRKQDLQRFREVGKYSLEFNFNLGDDRWDRLVSLPPYNGSALRMFMKPFITTSIGLLMKT